MILVSFTDVEPADLPPSPWGVDFLEGVWSQALWFFQSNQMWLAIALAILTASGVVALILSIYGYREDDDDDD